MNEMQCRAPVAQYADPVALREPTEDMMNAARDWSYKKYGTPIGSDAAIGCWQAMFDAAPQPSASIPEGNPDLNLAAWVRLDRPMPDTDAQVIDKLRDENERMTREASYHQQELNSLLKRSRIWQDRAEKAEATLRAQLAEAENRSDEWREEYKAAEAGEALYRRPPV